MSDMPIVYIARNFHNNKTYIGVTKRTLAVRRRQHILQAKKNTILPFHRAIAKYGEESFEFSILETFNDVKAAFAAEERLIRELKPDYNVSRGGRGPNLLRWSEDHRANAVAALRRSWTDERRKLASAMFKGRYVSDETRAKIKAARPKFLFCKPVVCLNDGKRFPSIKDAAASYGIKPKTIGEVLAGRQIIAGKWSFAWAKDVPSEQARLDLLEALSIRRQTRDIHRKNGAYRGRPVLCLNDGVVYPSGRAAARFYGLAYMTVSNLCRKGGHTNSGLKFMFADADEPVIRRKKTDEEVAAYRLAISNGLKAAQNKNRKRVICLDTGSEFDSLSQAAKEYGLTITSITEAIKRKGKAAGVSFRFVEGR